MLSSVASAFALSMLLQAAPSQDGPIATASAGESADAQRTREAIAYSIQMPPDAPREDYPLVAWCEALVLGHVTTGESLTDADELDRDIIRLGRLEATDFRSALATAEPRATPAMKRAAAAAAASAASKWAPVHANPDEAMRSQVFGLFMGLPGRCEHAARRIRNDISTPPASLEDVGLERSGASAP